ncbi:SMU1112c/YaeR family gloxylase I-like metalloprotein [Legionella israelensis]|nr:VOC family protein [Legionella israelensis]
MYNEVIFSSLRPFNQKNMLNRIHHIAIICSDYEKSKHFYTHVLGLEVVKETFREERQSYKLDLSLHGEYIIELFSFPDPPERISRPEARGLRHLAFEVDDLQKSVNDLKNKKIEAESIRLDKATQKYFTFIFDPDHLPIELYEK